MNYQHAFHAGNFADVVKHAILARLVAYQLRKEAAFRFLDIHAGAGVYDLTEGRAERTGEWRQGVGRIAESSFAPEVEALLEPYRAAIARANPGGGLVHYPGSPEIVLDQARPQDRLTLVELEPTAAAELRRHYRRDGRVAVVELDGWVALGAYVPPKERRGIVLIDPPFEQPNEFARMRDGLKRAHGKWPGGVYALWYPIKDILAADAFARELAATRIPRMLRAEVLLRHPRNPDRLNGCGLVIVNPPFTLAEELGVLLPALAGALADGEGARARLDEIAGEAPRDQNR